MVTTTLKSGNKKLVGDMLNALYSGRPIAMTARKVGSSGDGTCPPTCSFLPKAEGGNGACYANGGPQAFVARRSGYDPTDAMNIYQFITDLPGSWVVRHLTSGDLGRDGVVDRPFVDSLIQAHVDNPKPVGFGYTHFWQDLDPAEFDRAPNLTFNASTETTEEALAAHALGWPTVTVVASGDTRKTWKEEGVRFVTCPNQAQAVNPVGCRDCLLCARGDRDYVIAFRAHGQSRKAIDVRLESLAPLPMAGD